MSRLVTLMDRCFYPQYHNNWDDDLFRNMILGYLKPSHIVLDLGAGAGIVQQMNFRGHVAKICGIDPDLRVVSNPHLDEGKQGQGESIPYADNSFDIVFADNVFEHLPDPTAVLNEVERVLKPGGLMLAKTPNTKHYMPLIARLTPHRFHQWINRLRGRSNVDTFPTQYLINSRSAVRKHAIAAGLQVKEIKLFEGRPEYMRLTAITYFCGWAYERLVNSSPLLAPFRILLIAVLQKPSSL